MAPSNPPTGSPLKADEESKKFAEAIKLVVDATCNVCGWQGKITLFSTTDEKIDACDTICPECGQVDYFIRFYAETPMSLGLGKLVN